MENLDRETLVALARHTGWPSVSLYLPTHRIAPTNTQDPIRLRNMAKSAYERLVSEGMKETVAEKFVAPLYAMADDETWWRSSGDGLAVFISHEGATTLQLDASMPEHLVVGDRFYLRPLAVVHLRTERKFYALALDKNGSRLFAGDLGSIEPIELEGAPTSESDSARFDQATKLGYMAPIAARQRHAPSGTGTHTFPGHGAEPSYEKDQMYEYARALDAAVCREIGATVDRPLVLLGTERFVAAYRELNNYPLLAPMASEGATDYLTPAMIHDRAIATLLPHFDAEEHRELERTIEAEGSALVTHDAEKIVAAAASGRVRTLFFDEGTGPYGTFDRESFEAHTVCDAEPMLLREAGDTAEVHDGECGWDLIDLAIAETILHDGDVRGLLGEGAPARGPVALLRY